MAIQSPAAATSDVESNRSYADWSAIFAGAIFAAAFSLIMLTFGSGLGLSMISVEQGKGISMRWWMIAAGLWFIWVAVSSFGAGGYLAGRMRHPIGDATEDEVETRDGINGLSVWAVGTLIAILLAMGGVGSLMGLTASATGSVAGGVASLVEEQGDYFASLILRDDTGASPSSDAQSEIRIILARSVSQGEVSGHDRDRLLRIAAAEAEVAPGEVEQRVDEALNTFEQARKDAIEAVEQARIAAVLSAFVVVATMVASAAIAYFGATLGGNHRDNGMPLRRFAIRRDP